MSAVLTATATPSPWRVALPAMVLVLLAIGLLYLDTLVAMVAIWNRSSTFAHAWLVPPIVLWLVWRKRAELALITPRPAPWVLLPMAVVSLGWLLGDLAGINAVTQLAFTALLVLSVPAVLGLAVARRLMFPLAFLFFMVPIGEFTTDIMMEWTADFTVWALQVSGVPVYREGLQFIIPSGAWSVIEACSGVRYLIASFMVGTLFAYLNYTSHWRRWVFVGISIIVPIVANWVRAYMIVMLGHLSSNTLAVGVDHLIYGWVFFGVVIGIMFVIGAKWSEPPAEAAAQPAATGHQAGGATTSRMAMAMLATLVVLAMAPAGSWQLRHPTPAPALSLVLPVLPGVTAAADQSLALEPRFEGAAGLAHQNYQADDGVVTVHVAYYRYQSFGAKLTSSSNLLIRSTDEFWNRKAWGTVSVPVAGQAAVTMRSSELIGGRTGAIIGRRHLWVRQVYWSGGRLTTSSQAATVYSVLARLLGRGDDGAMLTFYASGEAPDAPARLDAFIGRHLPALVAQMEQTRNTASH
jgi:exosortase A